MIEPIALSDFFLGFFSAAMIILTAALYAALYAWSKITADRWLRIGALFAYGLLVACVVLFSGVMNLDGHWRIVTLSMAVGYWWMPRLIWRLCVATHADQARQ